MVGFLHNAIVIDWTSIFSLKFSSISDLHLLKWVEIYYNIIKLSKNTWDDCKFPQKVFELKYSNFKPDHVPKGKTSWC